MNEAFWLQHVKREIYVVVEKHYNRPRSSGIKKEKHYNPMWKRKWFLKERLSSCEIKTHMIHELRTTTRSQGPPYDKNRNCTKMKSHSLCFNSSSFGPVPQIKFSDTPKIWSHLARRIPCLDHCQHHYHHIADGGVGEGHHNIRNKSINHT